MSGLKKAMTKRLTEAKAHSLGSMQSLRHRKNRTNSFRDVDVENDGIASVPTSPVSLSSSQDSFNGASSSSQHTSDSDADEGNGGSWDSYGYPNTDAPPRFDRLAADEDIFLGFKKSGKKKKPKFLDECANIVQEVEFRGTIIQVEELPTANIIGRRLRVVLNDRGFRAERKAFHYSIGEIDMTAAVKGVEKMKTQGIRGAFAGAGEVAKDWAKAKLSQDSFIKPEYFGHGVVYLETTWSYLYILSCQLHDNLIIENGCWYASDSTIEVGLHVESNIMTGLLGGGFTETRLKGEGWVVIKLPVSFSELHRVQLENSEVRISEGQIVLLRRGNIVHKVKKATKSITAMKATGEGLVQSFKGTGELWIMPTVMLKEMLEKRKNPETSSLSGLSSSLSAVSSIASIIGGS